MEKIQKPWGWYQTLIESDNFLVKVIQVDSGERTSLQSHEHRREHWVVVDGMLTVRDGNDSKRCPKDQYVFVASEEKHRACNEDEEPVKFVEVQMGEELREDDITRYDDDYDRD